MASGWKAMEHGVGCEHVESVTRVSGSFSILAPLEHWATATPNTPAIVFGEQSVSYSEMMAWSDQMAAELENRGLGPGDRVSIVGANSVEWCVSALGSIAAGGVVAPLNHRWGPREITQALENADPRFVVADDEHQRDVTAAISPGARTDVLTMDLVRRLENAEPVESQGRHSAPAGDESVVIVYTSGSTGRPKGVTFTHEGILTSIFEWSLLEAGFRGPQRRLLMLPLAGCAGIIRGVLFTLANGGTLFLEPRVDPDRALRVLSTERITVLNSVPFVFERISESSFFKSTDLSSLLLATVGGAPVSRALLDVWAAKGVTLRQIWGMTEGGGACSINGEALAMTRPELCGKGGIWTRIKTVRGDGQCCAPDEPGEILLSGPGVTPGYWNDPELTSQSLVDGWLYTGDIGCLDSEGNLTFVDRKKDMIISGGINIATREIEEVISELEEIAEVAVVGVQHARFGEVVAAVIVVKKPIPTESVRAHCRARLADFKVPSKIIVADDPLPRLATGKISKPALRERYAIDLGSEAS